MKKSFPKIFIDGKSRRFGIIGYPLTHTLSPIIHNGMIDHLDIPGFYFPLEIRPDDFTKMIGTLKNIFEGFNVTVPFKEKIIPYLDEICFASKKIGAVNTVFLKGDKWVGTNTDWKGFGDSIEIDCDVRLFKKNILILGAGGSARACFFAAVKKGAGKVTIANRTVEKAEKILADIESGGTKVSVIGIQKEELNKASQDADIIINTTSIGLKKDDIHYFNFENVKPQAFAYDLIYSIETDFIKNAREKKIKTGNGLGMLVRQGAYSFERWFRINPDIKLMKEFAGFHKD